uniref:DUF4939 domain-containing protein n=1 Tax=Sinocyclocheilus anshuiensis TaxID=1608454 RepID=A0A671S889_9TELE
MLLHITNLKLNISEPLIVCFEGNVFSQMSFGCNHISLDCRQVVCVLYNVLTVGSALFMSCMNSQRRSLRSKVAFLISLLNGNALEWARAIWNADSAIINSYDDFKDHFKEVFGFLLLSHTDYQEAKIPRTLSYLSYSPAFDPNQHHIDHKPLFT